MTVYKSVFEKSCPRCGGDLLEYGRRPQIAGGREMENSFKCNRCECWYFRDSAFGGKLIKESFCPLCKTESVHKHYYSDTYGTSETYRDFSSCPNSPNEEKMKSEQFYCSSCHFNWKIQYCISCGSKNCHTLKTRLNAESGKSYYHYMDLHACFACGETWYTAEGGSD